jgi:hypothetical protein
MNTNSLVFTLRRWCCRLFNKNGGETEKSNRSEHRGLFAVPPSVHVPRTFPPAGAGVPGQLKDAASDFLLGQA